VTGVDAPLSPAPDPIQYELRIGVTGHRELTNAVEVAGAVRALLDRVVTVLERASADPLGPHGSPQSLVDRLDRRLAELLSLATRVAGPPLDALAALVPRSTRALLNAPRWPRVPISPRRPRLDQQTPLKLTVISSLAAGADQIVAEAVCDMVRHPERRNRYLEAVLPFPVALYERDFTNPRDLATFHRLLSLDRGRLDTHPEPTVLFPHFPNTPDPINLARRVPREEAYAAAGRYVVDTSEIVVAVWEPSREEKPGGTGATVRYALDRGRVVLWLDPANLGAGPFMLRAPNGRRPEAPAPAGRSDAVTVRVPDGVSGVDPVAGRAKQLSRNFHRLAAYNRDGAIDVELLRRELDTQASELSRTARACGLPDPVVQVLIDALLPHVVRAEHLSGRYKELRDFSARLWPAAAAFAVSLMAFQILFLPALYWLAVVELGVLLLGYVSYRVSLYEAWHEKWLNDRRLAEGLRGALYATLVRPAVDGPMDDARPSGDRRSGRVDHPLPFYDPANAWFVASLKRVLAKERRRLPIDLDDRQQRGAVTRFLQDGWLRPQADYHARRAATRARLITGATRLRLAMILALGFVAVLHALGTGHDGEHPVSFARLDLWVGLATIALPAWAAALHVMLSVDDHERLSERSAHMVPLLGGLADELGRLDDLDHLRACVTDAERILDLESAEWAESLGDRRPEFTG
jgi:hypothetical protein